MLQVVENLQIVRQTAVNKSMSFGVVSGEFYARYSKIGVLSDNFLLRLIAICPFVLNDVD